MLDYAYENTPGKPILAGDTGLPTGPIGDLDGDGFVGGADLGLLLGAWNSRDAAADLNHDGIVGGADLGVLLGNWS